MQLLRTILVLFCLAYSVNADNDKIHFEDSHTGPGTSRHEDQGTIDGVKGAREQGQIGNLAPHPGPGTRRHEGQAAIDEVIGAREQGQIGNLAPLTPRSETIARNKAIEIGQSNVRFTQNLYKELSHQEGNIFFSPLSIHSILTMAYAGAEGATADQMSRALFLASNKLNALSGYKALTGVLSKSNSGVTLNVANKIYTRKGVLLKRRYLTETRPAFQFEAEGIDFEREEAARRTINLWVETKTNQLIKNAIPEGILNANTAMVLVNAIYFKANWLTQFDEDYTRNITFTTHANRKIQVSVMNTISTFNYKDNEEEGYKVLELPYEEDKVSMMILLPNNYDGLPSVERILANQSIPSLFEGMSKVNVDVILPKFTLEQSTELNEPLRKLGMVDMFSGAANFSSLLRHQEKVRVSQVAHKAYIEVSEKGTKAAAVTYVPVQTLSINSFPKVFFTAVHPFIYILRHKETNSILFIGRYSHPASV